MFPMINFELLSGITDILLQTNYLEHEYIVDRELEHRHTRLDVLCRPYVYVRPYGIYSLVRRR